MATTYQFAAQCCIFAVVAVVTIQVLRDSKHPLRTRMIGLAILWLVILASGAINLLVSPVYDVVGDMLKNLLTSYVTD